jgi:hypothetical protein
MLHRKNTADRDLGNNLLQLFDIRMVPDQSIAAGDLCQVHVVRHTPLPFVCPIDFAKFIPDMPPFLIFRNPVAFVIGQIDDGPSPSLEYSPLAKREAIKAILPFFICF